MPGVKVQLTARLVIIQEKDGSRRAVRPEEADIWLESLDTENRALIMEIE